MYLNFFFLQSISELNITTDVDVIIIVLEVVEVDVVEME